MASLLSKVKAAKKKAEEKLQNVGRNLAKASKGQPASAAYRAPTTPYKSVVPTKTYMPTKTSAVTGRAYNPANPAAPEVKAQSLQPITANKYLPQTTAAPRTASKTTSRKSEILESRARERSSSSSKNGGRQVVRTLSRQEGDAVIAKNGLTGFMNEDLSGLTAGEANMLAQEAKADLLAQQSALTSGVYNPATLSGAKKIYENFNFRLKETMNDSWNSKGTKEELAKGLYESTANGYAKLFNTADEFDSLYNTSQEFKGTIDGFTRAGGDINSIKSRISPEPRFDQTMEATPEGTYMPKMQSTQEYLSKLSIKPPAGLTPAETDAFNSLIPERELAQEQIVRAAQIPEQYKNLYFGTPEQLGILEEKRIIAEEQKKILERKSKEDQSDLKAQAKLAIQKNNADFEIESSKIEENRLAAKNYMTGMLAKLGALKTTGAAVAAIQTVESEYQRQEQELRTATKFANREIEIRLVDAVNDVEIKRDEDILNVQSDLSKDREEVMKEVFKLQQAADKEIYGMTDKAAHEFRTQREKYVKEATSLAEKNAKAFAKAVGSYNPKSLTTGGTKSKKAFIADGKAELRAVTGPDGKVDPAVYLRMWQDWDRNNLGTLTNFKTTFPPAQYVNPDNQWPELKQLGFVPKKVGSSSSSGGTSPDDI